MHVLRFASLHLLAGLFLGAGLAADATAVEIDLLLGAPFTVRERPTLGPADAAVIVIEVRSFQCNQCRAFHDKVFPLLSERYLKTGSIRWVMLDAPIAPDQPNNPALEVAWAAHRQGRYWEMQDFLFEHAHRPSSILFGRAATQPGIDASRLQSALSKGEARSAMAADLAEITALKVTALPTFILRKRKTEGGFTEARIDGYPTEAHFRSVLDGLMATPE
ncbi:hypothetical protein MASR2M8_19620 [Opitutaceae bacterium]